MAIKKDLLANALKIRGNQSIGDSIYRRLRSDVGNNTVNQNLVTENGLQSEYDWNTKNNTETTTIGTQLEHNENTENKPAAYLVHNNSTEGLTNGLQSEHNSGKKNPPVKNPTTLKKNLSSIIGTQRKLILAIYLNCKTFGGTVSQEMTIEHLANLAQCNKKSIKTTIFRLKEKGFIETIEQKSGRGGWIRYGINQALYTDIMQQEYQIFNNQKNQDIPNRITNNPQLEHNMGTKSNTERYTTYSSSSSLDQTTTITSKPEKTSLPMEWQEIDFEPLEKIRFHKGHVEQLFKHGLELQPVQESIYHFSFDLTVNNKGKDIKTDPLGFFMGIMKRSGYYAAPENYESPQEQGRRLFLEQEAKKAQKKLQAEKELMMSYFKLWVNQFTEQEKIDLVGKTELGPNRTMLTTEHKLVMYYKNTIWPEQYKKMVAGVS